MPEITAEQLAEQWARVKDERDHGTMRVERLDLVVMMTQDEAVNHIINCLREHEERAAEVRKPDPADPPEPIEFWWSNHNISEYYCANSKILAMVWWDAPGWWWRVDGDVATFEATLSAAKAAVEKAVRNG